MSCHDPHGWAVIGPLIEKHKVELERPEKGEGAGRWSAWIGQGWYGYGDTALVAAINALISAGLYKL